MLITSICCAYNISMSLAKFSMAVNRILQKILLLIKIIKKDPTGFIAYQIFSL